MEPVPVLSSAPPRHGGRLPDQPTRARVTAGRRSCGELAPLVSRSPGLRGRTMNLSLRRLLTLSAAMLAATLAVRSGAAQEPGARRTEPALVSPEIAADHRVTFRLRAPEAKAVTVSGDFGADVEMRKNADGIWSATVGPLAPEMYVYYFTADSVRLTDPSNPQVKIGYVTSTTTSLVTVPGDSPAFYDVQDVPHGEIRTLLYKSRSNGTTRELTVYVPPGTTTRAIAATRCSTCCTASPTTIIRGTATAAPTTSSTISSRRTRSSRSWSSCPLATAVRRSTATAPGSRRRPPVHSAATRHSTSAICSRTSSR